MLIGKRGGQAERLRAAGTGGSLLGVEPTLDAQLNRTKRAPSPPASGSHHERNLGQCPRADNPGGSILVLRSWAPIRPNEPLRLPHFFHRKQKQGRRGGAARGALNRAPVGRVGGQRSGRTVAAVLGSSVASPPPTRSAAPFRSAGECLVRCGSTERLHGAAELRPFSPARDPCSAGQDHACSAAQADRGPEAVAKP